jgi:hypothetical protein
MFLQHAERAADRWLLLLSCFAAREKLPAETIFTKAFIQSSCFEATLIMRFQFPLFGGASLLNLRNAMTCAAELDANQFRDKSC